MSEYQKGWNFPKTLSNEVRVAKQADAMGLNLIPSQGIGSTPIPDTTYIFTVDAANMKGLMRTRIRQRKFFVKARDVNAAWKSLDDMLWAEDLPNVKHEIRGVVMFTGQIMELSA